MMWTFSNLNHFKICPSWCCIDLLLHPFHPHRILESLTIVGARSPLLGQTKVISLQRQRGRPLKGGKGGDTVFDILVVLLQLQYFLLGATVTKKILGLLPSFGNIFQSINTQTTPRSDTVLIGPKYFPNIVLFL